MNKKDIILIKIPFTDLSEQKLKPALILAALREDFLCCFLSSRLVLKTREDLVVKKDPQNGLKADSLIRCGKIFTLHQSLAERHLGKISQKIYNAVISKIMRIIR